MSEYGRPRKRHTFLKLLICVLLALVVGFGVWIGLSFKKAAELFGEADAAYAQMEQSIEAEDYKTALTHARTAATFTSQASDELAGQPWEIAENLPVLGTDVSAMRSIGSISGTLADDAVLPTLDALDELMSDGIVENGTIQVEEIGQKLEQVVQLASTLRTANDVVDACSVQLDGVSPSHFAQINEWVGSLRETMASIDGVLDQYARVADMVIGMSNALNTLMDVTGITDGSTGLTKGGTDLAEGITGLYEG